MASNKVSYYRNQNSGDGSWSDFLGNVYSGVAVGIGHPKWYVMNTIKKGWRAITGSIEGDDDDRRGGGNDTEGGGGSSTSSDIDEIMNQGLKVVGVGYGRKGTYSLALALDELGFSTLHTQQVLLFRLCSYCLQRFLWCFVRSQECW